MLDNGSVMAGFLDEPTTDCGPYESPCAYTGFRILDPNASQPVTYKYSFPVRTKYNSEVHDVERLDSGEFLVTDMDLPRSVGPSPGRSVGFFARGVSGQVCSAEADSTTGRCSR